MAVYGDDRLVVSSLRQVSSGWIGMQVKSLGSTRYFTITMDDLRIDGLVLSTELTRRTHPWLVVGLRSAGSRQNKNDQQA